MINGLYQLLQERNLVQTCPLTALAHTRLGIDLDVYLDSLLSKSLTKEPFVAALGGAPLALLSLIDTDLRAFDRSHIKPVVVFSGIPPAKSVRPLQQPDPRIRLRQQAWDAYEDGDVETMETLLAKSGSVDARDLTRLVTRAFRHRNVEFIVAPYLTGGQLVSLERHPRGYANALYGSTSLFLFPKVDKIVLDIDLKAGTFTFATKAAVLAELGLQNDEDFLDVGILAGWDHAPTFPPLTDGTIGGSPASSTPADGASDFKPVNLRMIADLVRQHRGGVNLVQMFSEHPAVKSLHYVDLFYKSKCLIKYSMVMRAEDGAVLPLPLSSSLATSAAPGSSGSNGAVNGAMAGASSATFNQSDLPSDLSDVFSPRLPDEVFLHLSRGLISHSVVSWLTSGYLAHPAPLDNGDTEEYRRFVRDTLTETPQSVNCVSLALASSVLQSSWKSRKVNAVYWWAPGAEKPVPYDPSVTQQLVSRIEQWNVPVSFVEEELRRQNSSTIDMALCLGATGTNDLAHQTKTPPRGKSHPLEKKDEIVANSLWRLLELRGFLNHDHLHTPYARALHLALRAAKLNDKLQEPLFLALELIRAGVLQGNYFTSPSTNASADDRRGQTTGNPTSDRSSSNNNNNNNNNDSENKIFSGGPVVETGYPGTQHLLLIMRALSLVPMSCKAEAWAAPVSRELLVFHGFAKSLGRSMRNLIETIASTMLLRGDARRARDDYLDIALSLPFQQDPNTGLGIVIKCYVEALMQFSNWFAPTEDQVTSTASAQDIKETKEMVLSFLEDSTFDIVKSVRAEINRGFRFWNCLMIAVVQLKEKNNIPKTLATAFEEADAWFQPFRLVV